MYSEQLNAGLLLKESLLLYKFPFLLLTQHSTVLVQQVTVLLGSLWRHTFINQLFYFLIDEQWTGGLLFDSSLDCRSYLVDQSFNLDRAVVLNVCGVLVLDEHIAQSVAGVDQVVELLCELGDLYFRVVVVLVD